VVVSTVAVLAVAVSTAAVLVVGSTAEASAVALSVGDVSPVAVSMAVAFVVAVLVGGTGAATGAITDSLMMSSSAAPAFRGGGAIRTDITVMTITHTITMDTAGTRTVTTVAAVTDTAMAADQGISEVSGLGDKPVRVFEIARPLVPVDNDADYVDPSDMACAMNIATLPPRVWIDETDGRTWFLSEVKRGRHKR
jgi:hypothetical protein